jgi:hypothetical protein
MPENQLPNLGGLTPEQIQDHLDRHPDGLHETAPECEIVCVIDRSGSMGAIVDDAIGGFNAFLDSQKKEAGTAVLSMTLFDHEHLFPYAVTPLREVPAFTSDTYVPRGSTALLDAVGSTLTSTATRHAATPAGRRPQSVVVAILTDGHENASVHYSREAIAAMIDERKAQGWQFVFLAADQAAFDAARQMHVAIDDVAMFRADAAGVRAASASMSRRVFDKRAMMAEEQGRYVSASLLADRAERHIIAEERRRGHVDDSDSAPPAGS